jgi:hypothetical protein
MFGISVSVWDFYEFRDNYVRDCYVRENYVAPIKCSLKKFYTLHYSNPSVDSLPCQQILGKGERD